MTIQQIFRMCEDMKKNSKYRAEEMVNDYFFQKYKEHSEKTFVDLKNKQSEIDEILRQSDFGEIPKE